MPMQVATVKEGDLAELIPPVEVIRERLARSDAEVSLLRKLLQLALRREREAARLIDEK